MKNKTILWQDSNPDRHFANQHSLPLHYRNLYIIIACDLTKLLPDHVSNTCSRYIYDLYRFLVIVYVSFYRVLTIDLQKVSGRDG